MFNLLRHVRFSCGLQQHGFWSDLPWTAWTTAWKSDLWNPSQINLDFIRCKETIWQRDLGITLLIFLGRQLTDIMAGMLLKTTATITRKIQQRSLLLKIEQWIQINHCSIPLWSSILGSLFFLVVFFVFFNPWLNFIFIHTLPSCVHTWMLQKKLTLTWLC